MIPHRSVALALALATPALAGDLHTVSPTGTADFVTIQAAVDAAADGDTVLVFTGDYAPFVVTAKEIAVVGRPGNAVAVLGGVTVVQTAAGREVVLAGMTISGSHTLPSSSPHAIVISGAAGPVRVEGCVIEGAEGLGYTGSTDFGGDAIRIDGSTDVSIVDSAVIGGDGYYNFGGFDLNRGGDGVHADGSGVAVHDSTVLAGDGGPEQLEPLGGLPGRGGHGAWLVASELFAQNDRFEGGDGGGFCAPGGHGVFVTNASAHADLLDNVLVGGTGCGNGQPLRLDGGGTANQIPGDARSHQSGTPAFETTPITFVFEGEPGDRAFLLLSSGADSISLPNLMGVLLLELPLASERRFMGVIPGSGTLVKNLVVPSLPPGVEADVLYLQSYFQDPTGTVWLASPSSLVILDL